MDLIWDLINNSQATSFRTTCPYCGSNNSLSINRVDGDWKYKCFDANCHTYGNYYTGYTLEELRERLRGPAKAKPYELPEHFIHGIANDLCYGYLCNNLCLNSVVSGKTKVAYDPKEDRVVFLVYDGLTLKGAVGRTLGNAKPKSRIYKGSETYPFICPGGKTLLIVEDCASACAATRLPEYTGMALLGTYLKPEYIPVICRYENVVVALDPDAKAKAVEINYYLRFYTNSRVQFIPKDIKNMTDEELWENLSHNQENGPSHP